jgi:hypothetical protein
MPKFSIPESKLSRIKVNSDGLIFKEGYNYYINKKRGFSLLLHYQPVLDVIDSSMVFLLQ